MARAKRNLEDRIRELKLELEELGEQYKTQLYFETMPEYDPIYKYCYSTSNRSIPHEHHHVDHWLRAVIKHMATRRAGHGGASTSAILVSVPLGFSEKGIDNWLAYETEKLRKVALKYKKRG